MVHLSSGLPPVVRWTGLRYWDRCVAIHAPLAGMGTWSPRSRLLSRPRIPSWEPSADDDDDGDDGDGSDCDCLLWPLPCWSWELLLCAFNLHARCARAALDLLAAFSSVTLANSVAVSGSGLFLSLSVFLRNGRLHLAASLWSSSSGFARLFQIIIYCYYATTVCFPGFFRVSFWLN